MVFLHPYNASDAFVPESFEGLEDACEMDNNLSLKQIVEYSFQGVNLGLNVYNDYDDSEEGASFPLDYDSFDGLQEMLDSRSKVDIDTFVDPVDTPPTNEQPSPTPES